MVKHLLLVIDRATSGLLSVVGGIDWLTDFLNTWTRIVSTIEPDVVKLGFYPMWNSLFISLANLREKEREI